MKNIAIFIKSLYSGTGGAEKQALLLYECLRMKYNVFIIVFKGDKINRKYSNVISSDTHEHMILKGNLIKRLMNLYSALKREKVDIIFSYLASTNFWGAVIGRLANVDYIVGGIRNSEFETHKLFVQKIVHNYLSDYTIFNNYRGYHNLTEKGFNKNKSVVIPNGLFIRDPIETRKVKSPLKIITVARFTGQKDYLTAIHAMKYLLENLHVSPGNFSYNIIGNGKLQEQIEEWIRDNNLTQVISVVKNPPNLKDYFAEADIYLCTSRFEGVSNSILEAMSFNLPVIATDAGDNNKLVMNDYNGYIVNISDYKTIAIRLYELINSYDKRIALGVRGYNHCRQNYSSEVFQASYVSFINKLSR